MPYNSEKCDATYSFMISFKAGHVTRKVEMIRNPAMSIFTATQTPPEGQREGATCPNSEYDFFLGGTEMPLVYGTDIAIMLYARHTRRSSARTPTSRRTYPPAGLVHKNIFEPRKSSYPAKDRRAEIPRRKISRGLQEPSSYIAC